MELDIEISHWQHWYCRPRDRFEMIHPRWPDFAERGWIGLRRNLRLSRLQPAPVLEIKPASSPPRVRGSGILIGKPVLSIQRSR